MSSRSALLLPLASTLLFAGACSSSPPPVPPAARPAETPVSDPAAVAARISGDWQFAMERGGGTTEAWLHFSLAAGELVGSLTGPDSNPREISKVVLKGDKISWQIENDFGKETYEGKLKGSSMEGTMRVSRSGGRRGGDSEGQEGSGGRSGGYGGRRGGGGRGGGGRGGGAASQITWRAFRSVQPMTPAAAPEPTKPGVLSP
jgi:hypothetical protein